MELTGNLIRLRRVKMEDAEQILEWENNPEFWSLSSSPGPFTHEDIYQFIQLSHDFGRDKQERWMIVPLHGVNPVGAVDIFCSQRSRKTAGIGILIGKPEDRKKGYASEALSLVLSYMNKALGMNTAECLIYPDNKASLRLFERIGFDPSGNELFKGKTAIRFVKKLPIPSTL